MNLVSEERDCGCLLGNNTASKEAFFSYCPKHAAALDMFTALKEIAAELGSQYLTDAAMVNVRHAAEAALELATGDSDG